MATFVLIPGAGTGAGVWRDVVAELERRGHAAVAVELPFRDGEAGLPEYADAALGAIGDREDLVVVGQSLGAFTAVQVCERRPARLLVLLAAMIPQPGETPGEWGENTRHAEAIPDVLARHGPLDQWGEDALNDVFLHDVPADVLARSAGDVGPQGGSVFASRWTATTWPDVPTRVLLCRDDRFFPPAFQRRLARERLGLEADEIDGGHVAMLSQPAALAERLAAYADRPTARPQA